MKAIVKLNDGSIHEINYQELIARSILFNVEEALLFYEGEGYEDDWVDEIKEIRIIY
ncbi:hypothetical protein [Ammoniphilus resinae]|uniref:Uncharacterized protein n=1 Tax=Ammoniphilus resinae TaxID=861532 RepID=A0ABS4GYR1_9BACL|nr:hypothetical protein [Ammoniphilus resinae]MBP1935020.1 hypothetical protein [Ammoniphilus resinae]